MPSPFEMQLIIGAVLGTWVSITLRRYGYSFTDTATRPMAFVVLAAVSAAWGVLCYLFSNWTELGMEEMEDFNWIFYWGTAAVLVYALVILIAAWIICIWPTDDE